MTQPAIRVTGLGKRYVIRHENRAGYRTIREEIANRVRGIGRTLASRRTAGPSREEFWALREVDLEVGRGERLGIIGRNGAGKSTFLKLLSRVTDPSAGTIRLSGSVGSLLEVGTGFHPEMTGRENIFLNGAILGMARAEIRKKFDEIVDFAGVERFLDTPVKRYSSGMFVRLGFSVAAHLEPDILIVDEVLAVGDAAFQQKCIQKMEQLSSDDNRTVIFVSHNLSIIETLCERVVWLEGGRIQQTGDASEVVQRFLASIRERPNLSEPPRNDAPYIAAIRVYDAANRETRAIRNGQRFTLEIDIVNRRRLPAEVAISVWDEERRPLWNYTHSMHGQPLLPTEESTTVRVSFDPPELSVRELSLDFATCGPNNSPYYHHLIDGVRLSVFEPDSSEFLRRYPEWPILVPAVTEVRSGAPRTGSRRGGDA